MKINWKDASKALTKLHPREEGDDDDEIPANPGSFFNFFEVESDPFEVHECFVDRAPLTPI